MKRTNGENSRNANMQNKARKICIEFNSQEIAFINGIKEKSNGRLNEEDIIKAIVRAVSGNNTDFRNMKTEKGVNKNARNGLRYSWK